MNKSEKEALARAARGARFDLELARGRLADREADVELAKKRLETAEIHFNDLKEHLEE